MDLAQVSRVVIYPAIGIARVGNSPSEYFVGPTQPGAHAMDPDDFRDAQGRIKRQASKFFVYGLDAQGRVLGELNAATGTSIAWRVQIANKKAAWYNFDLALDIPAAEGEFDLQGNATPGGLPLLSQRRNRTIAERQKLMIEPTEQRISGVDINADGGGFAFDDGEIDGTRVYLGELRTDGEGRLLFLGGRGKSASFDGSDLTTFANNNGWHDDVSDGPVDASVTLPDGRVLAAEGAWVVVAPPNYAVGVQAFSTGYDLLRDVAARKHPSVCPDRPGFYRDIYPILRHLTVNQWVNAGVARDLGWGSAYDFDEATLIARAANPGDSSRPFRQIMFESFRNPAFERLEAQALPPLYGDAVTFNVDSTDPRNWFAVTELQYDHLRRWAAGDFDVDEPPRPVAWQELTPTEQANGLTEAALEETLGGPFHPGCEFTWPMRHAQMYGDNTPFRIKRRQQAREDWGVAISPDIALAPGGPLDGSSPGDITKWMAVPWQSDTSSCLSAYRAFSGEYMPTFWPARVPNDVLTQDDYAVLSDPAVSDDDKVQAFRPRARKKWLRGFIYNDRGQLIGGSSITDRLKGVEKFTHEWYKAGIVVRKALDANPELFPQEVWVETGRQLQQTTLLKANGEPEEYSDVPAWVRANPRTLR